MPRDADLFSGVLPFVHTAQAKSFSRAANQLGVSTAAVSKSIKRLEEDLDVKLLDRSSRVVSLTRPGELFLERCLPAVLSVRGAREAMQSVSREPHGALSCTLPFILAPFVVPHLGRLGAQYPRLEFHLNLTDRVARLADEQVDVAIRMGPLESSSLVARLLCKTRWVTVAAPAYLASRGQPKTPAELATHNCLRFVGPDRKPREWTFREAGRAKTVRTSGNLLIDHGAHLLDAAAAGMGLCQVLDFMVEDALRGRKLVEVLGAYAAPGPTIHALTTPARASSSNVRVFVAFLVEAFRR